MHCINGLRGISLNQLLAQKLERVPRQNRDLCGHETVEHQLTLRVSRSLWSIIMAYYIRDLSNTIVGKAYRDGNK